MIIEHLMICQSSSIDFEKNSLSIFDLVEDLTVNVNSEDAPVQLNLSFIAIIKRTDEIGTFPIALEVNVDKPDKIGTPATFNTVISEELKRLRVRINLNIILSDGSGDYTISAMIKERPDTLRTLTTTITRNIVPQIGKEK